MNSKVEEVGVARIRPIAYLLESPARMLLAAALAFALLYALASLWLPFGWDHGMLAAVGDVIANGGVPFRDAFDLKGPVAYLPFALSALLFGDSMWGIRVIDLAIMVPALYFLYRTVGGLTGPMIGIGAALALYFWIASRGFFFTAQPEGWATAARMTAMCLLLRPAGAPAPGARTFFAVGALIACAGLMKPHFMALGLCALAYIAVVGNLSLRRRIVLAAFLAAGASAVVAAVVGWLAINGAFDEFIEAHFLFNLTSYGDQSASLGVAVRIVFWYVEQGVIPVLAPFVAAGLWAHRKNRPTLVVLTSWLVIAFLTVVVQGKFFEYHWFVMYPPMVICAALGVHAVLQGAQTSLMKVVVAGAVAMFALHVARPPLRDVVQWTKRIAGGSEQAYFASYVFNETYSAADMVAAGRHIRERTKPENGVFVWGNDAVIRFLAGRRDPTRFTHVLPIEAPGPFRERYRAEMMQSLTTDPPAYVVVGGPWVSKQTALGFFPDFTALIAADYVLETTIGHVDLYRLKGHAAVP